jgi:hypothetical protein
MWLGMLTASAFSIARNSLADAWTCAVRISGVCDGTVAQPATAAAASDSSINAGAVRA